MQSQKRTREAAKTNLTAYGEARSITEWSEITGISEFALLDRMHNGLMTPEEILTTQYAKHRNLNQEYYAFGESHTISEWAHIRGMEHGTLKYRILRKNMSIEEALTKPTRGPK